MLRSATWILIVSLASLVPTAAAAQANDGSGDIAVDDDGSGGAVAPADIERARALFWEGNEAYVVGNYAAAIPLFEEAYRASSNPRLLDYIGRCHANEQRYTEALNYFGRFAASSPEAAEEAAPRIAAMRAEMTRLAVAEASRRSLDARDLAVGRQPPPRGALARELGTTMRDVPVQFSSSPQGAEVFIDGTDFGPYGTTPLETNLFTGNHFIEVRMPYYETERRVVPINVPGRGESIPTIRFRLQRQLVPVNVAVEPLTASVTFVGEDGVRRDLGVGGWEGELPAGPGRFILQQGGGDRTVEHLIEPPDDGAPLNLALRLADPSDPRGLDIGVGTLRVETEAYQEGTVYVDGRVIGPAPGPVTAQLAPGPHLVEVRAAGRRPFRREVTIEREQEAVVYVGALDRAGGGSAWAGWTLASVGAAAVGGGGYLLAAGDEEGLGVGLMAGGGAAFAGGLAWAIVARATRQRESAYSTSTLDVTPTRGGAMLNWRWSMP